MSDKLLKISSGAFMIVFGFIAFVLMTYAIGWLSNASYYDANTIEIHGK